MKKVLIVEDDPVAGLAFRRSLEKQGFATEVATDGVKGLERLAEFCPDALLLDLMLPRITGIAVLRKLRMDPKFQDLPVIVVTNALVPAFADQAAAAGADRVVDKCQVTPVAVAELIYALLRAKEERKASVAS
jgi:CheY-like chemotaxis protein